MRLRLLFHRDRSRVAPAPSRPEEPRQVPFVRGASSIDQHRYRFDEAHQTRTLETAQPEKLGRSQPFGNLIDEPLSASIRGQMIALLTAVLGMTFFLNLGGSRTLGSHETFVTVPARQMLATGDWIVPRFGQIPRLEKPPLCYWLVCATSAIYGEVTAWSARLPAALSAVCLTVLLIHWGTKRYGEKAGWAAGFVTATSVWVLIYARKAEVDMFLCLLTTASLYLVAEQPPSESGGRTVFRAGGIAVCLAFAWLAKFHYGLAMVLVPAVIFSIVERRRSLLCHLCNPLWLAVLAAAIFIWPALLLERVPHALDVWGRETVGRAVGDLGSEPVWYYLPKILWLALPWTPFWLAGLVDRWRAAKAGDSHERFSFIWLVSHLILLSLSAGKHKHYLMATLPVTCLWSGRMLARFLQGLKERHWGLSRGQLFCCVVLTVAGGGVMALATAVHWPATKSAAIVLGLTFAVVGGTGFVFMARGQVKAVIGFATLNFCTCFAIVCCGILPQQDSRQLLPEIASIVEDVRQPEQPLCVLGLSRAGLMHFLPVESRRYEHVHALLDDPRIHHGKSVCVVTYASLRKSLAMHGPVTVLQSWPPGKHGRYPHFDALELIHWQPIVNQRSESESHANAKQMTCLPRFR